MYQARKVNSYVFIFIRLFYWIMELFRQCSIVWNYSDSVVFFWNYSDSVVLFLELFRQCVIFWNCFDSVVFVSFFILFIFKTKQ